MEILTGYRYVRQYHLPRKRQQKRTRKFLINYSSKQGAIPWLFAAVIVNLIMSRSFRKPYITDTGRHRKWAKKDANKTVWHRDTYNGAHYKRLYCTWNICDYKWYNPTEKKAYRKWQIYANATTKIVHWKINAIDMFAKQTVFIRRFSQRRREKELNVHIL